MSEVVVRWFVLATDVSVRVVWLAAVGGLGIAALRIRNSNVRHAVWVGVLAGMLAMPALDLLLPALALPVPRAWAGLMSRAQISQPAVELATPEQDVSVAASNMIQRLDELERPAEPAPISTERNLASDSRIPTAAQRIPARPVVREIASPQMNTDVAASAVPQPAIVAPAIAEQTHAAAPAATRGDWLLIAAAVWASGASILLLRLLLGHTGMRRLVLRARPVSLPSPGRFSGRGDARVEIREGAELIVPVTVGLFRSTVLLPTAWKTWPEEKLAHVLAHERAHARRRDCLTAFAADICVAVYWFHPLAWWLRKRLATLAEAACDDAAIGSTGNRTAYARHLLEIVSVLAGRSGRLTTPGVAMARQSNIESRIDSILDFKRPLSDRMTPAVRFSIAMILIPLIGLSAALRPAIASEQPAANAVADAIAVADPPRVEEKRVDVPQAEAVAPTGSRDEQMLTAAGRVLRADGSPAAGAIVSVVGETDEQSPTARTEKDGQFRLSHPFTRRSYLLASTADGLQAIQFIAPATARATFEGPIELRLSPAWPLRVSVTKAGKPAPDARVAVFGRYVLEGRTGTDGLATFWLQDGEKISDVLAWDRQQDDAGRAFGRLSGNPQPTGLVKLALAPTRRQTYQVVDASGQAIPDFRLSFAWATGWGGENWLRSVTTTHQTDAQGEVTAPWQPHSDRSWIITNVDHSSDVTKVQVEHLRRVNGRLIMPSGENPEGILVSAGGFGRGNPSEQGVRARRDGTFTFWALSTERYLLNISDENWASDGWSGTALAGADAPPATIALHIDHGVPLTVNVTKGPNSEPCPNVDIHGETHQAVVWVDRMGASHAWNGNIPFDLGTDGKGVAHFAIKLGGSLSCRIGDWRAWESINPKSKDPVSVTFHRPWLENRTVFGQMRYAGAPRSATPSTSVRAWSDDGTSLLVEMYPDGWFAIAGNPQHPLIYIKDSQSRLNGFRGGDLVPTGIYSGTIVDEGGSPLAHCRVKLVNHQEGTVFSPRGVVLDEVECDDQGRFQFTMAPTSITVAPVVEKSGASQGKELLPTVYRDLYLQPGEVYRDDRIVVLSQAGKTVTLPRRAPLKSAAESLSELLRDARLLHMKVLVLAEGDATASVREVSRKFVDEREFPEILRYLPLVIPASELPAATPILARFNARSPARGEVLLLAVDTNGRGAREWLVRGEESSSVQSGRAFLKSEAPAPRDARQLLTAALAEAKASRRDVWVTACGPRSEACFRLVRWIDDQQQPLDYDYVFVPLVIGRDEHVEEVLRGLGRPPQETSLPWFAVVGKVGAALVTSDGPRGNIGYPENGAARRYLRQMIDRTAGTMTAAEIDRLIQSLGK